MMVKNISYYYGLVIFCAFAISARGLCTVFFYYLLPSVVSVSGNNYTDRTPPHETHSVCSVAGHHNLLLIYFSSYTGLELYFLLGRLDGLH
jgi:hypothetical protein